MADGWAGLAGLGWLGWLGWANSVNVCQSNLAAIRDDTRGSELIASELNSFDKFV